MFFITLDITRAIGLNQALPDLKIVCLHSSPLIQKMREMGTPVFCIEDELDIHDMRNSADMILAPAVQQWMMEQESEPEVLFFKPTAKLEAIVTHQGWKCLNSDPALNAMFEDKVDFVNICKELGIAMPPSGVYALGDITEDILRTFGNNSILQLRRGHAGETSFMIKGFEDIERLQKTHNATHQVKIASLIDGRTLTLNACISGEEILIGDLMEQITGIPKLNSNIFGTCGVIVRLQETFPTALRDMTMKLGTYMRSKGYQGIFGIDVVEDALKNIYMIECNPRLTASISFHTQLQMMKGETPFVSLMTHRTPKEFPNTLVPDVQPSQLILRNTTSDEVIIEHALNSGVYQKEGDKCIFLRHAATFDSLLNTNEILLLIRPSGSRVSSGLEIAYVQSLQPLVNGNEVDHVIDQILKSVKLQPPWFIAQDAFWKDRFGTVVTVQDVFSKPLQNLHRLNAHALSRNRQTQTLPDEPSFELLGEYEEYYLIKKYEGTFGWIPKGAVLESKQGSTEAELQSPEAFFVAFRTTPYLWGGLSTSGIDCSGLIQQYFRRVLGRVIPKNSRDQRKLGKAIEISQIQDNDLVFLTSRASQTHHVALFYQGALWHACLKEGKVVHQHLDKLTRDYQIEETRRI